MIKKNYNIINFNLNKFLEKIKIKKQYKKILKYKMNFINNIKEQNYKITNYNIFFKNQQFIKYESLVIYIINIFFSQTNTLVYITNFIGKLKLVFSAGNFNFKGKRKKSRLLVLKMMLNYLTLKLKFLRKKPVALHFKNIGFFKF
jgi:ribosomal protein S11